MLLLLEIIAIIFSLICVWLTTRNNIWCWPTGIVGVLAFLILFYHVVLYAEVILQIIFLVQSLYGWYNWAKLKNKPPAPITKMLNKEKWQYSIIGIILFGVIYGTLYNTGASILLVDTLTTTISIIANWLLAKRKIENWYLWIFVDVIYVGMYAYKDLYMTSILYIVFFGLAIKGLFNWRLEYDS